MSTGKGGLNHVGESWLGSVARGMLYFLLSLGSHILVDLCNLHARETMTQEIALLFLGSSFKNQNKVIPCQFNYFTCFLTIPKCTDQNIKFLFEVNEKEPCENQVDLHSGFQDSQDTEKTLSKNKT